MLKKLKRYWYNLTHPIIGEVWQLHRVTNKHASTELQRTYEITPQRLENLIHDFLNKGYVFVSMADVRRIILGEKTQKKKFISVTLDDGYADNYEEAYPIFRKYNIPFCIYLCEKMVKGQIREDGVEHYHYLSNEQLDVLNKDSLCTLGGHTASHAHLSRLTKDQQYQEIMFCKQWLESMTGEKMIDFAYPYGDYNEITLEIVEKLGIHQAVAAWGGNVRKDKSKILCIPRKLVTQTSIE